MLFRDSSVLSGEKRMLRIKVNGVELAYEEYGTGKETFIFTHGWQNQSLPDQFPGRVFDFHDVIFMASVK